MSVSSSQHSRHTGSTNTGCQYWTLVSIASRVIAESSHLNAIALTSKLSMVTCIDGSSHPAAARIVSRVGRSIKKSLN